MTGNGNHGRQSSPSCTSGEIMETAVETLDNALNRLRAYCDILDWMFIHPPEEPELLCMTMDEIRRTLGTAISARDTLLRLRHAGACRPGLPGLGPAARQ